MNHIMYLSIEVQEKKHFDWWLIAKQQVWNNTVKALAIQHD